jgi:hypothetical protein
MVGNERQAVLAGKKTAFLQAQSLEALINRTVH